MKSDHEFIEGIYEKVKRYEEEAKKNSDKLTFIQKLGRWCQSHRIQTALATGVTFGAFLLFVGLNKPANKPEQNIEPMSLSNYEQGNVDENTGISNVSAYDNSNVRTIPDRNESIKVLGKVTSVYDKDGIAFVELYVMNSNLAEIYNKTITFSYRKEEMPQTELFVNDDEFIVYLTNEEENYYTLSDVNQDLYRFYEENTEGKIYMSSAGEQLKEDDITK